MKTAFVTGGSRGIGKSIALDLGKKFHVVVGYSVSNEKAKEVSDEILNNGGSSSTVQINISESESVDKVVTISEDIVSSLLKNIFEEDGNKSSIKATVSEVVKQQRITKL